MHGGEGEAGAFGAAIIKYVARDVKLLTQYLFFSFFFFFFFWKYK